MYGFSKVTSSLELLELLKRLKKVGRNYLPFSKKKKKLYIVSKPIEV